MLKPALDVLLVITNILALCFSLPNKIVGPGIVIYKTFEHSDPPITDIDVWMTQRKYNRSTNVLDISLTSPWQLGDDIIVELIGATKKEGGYKPGQFYLKHTFCAILKTMLGDVFAAFLDVAGVDDCPIPDGAYKIENFYLDSNKLPGQLMYGDYRMEVKLYLNEELKGNYYIYLDVVPKEL